MTTSSRIQGQSLMSDFRPMILLAQVVFLLLCVHGTARSQEVSSSVHPSLPSDKSMKRGAKPPKDHGKFAGGIQYLESSHGDTVMGGACFGTGYGPRDSAEPAKSPVVAQEEIAPETRFDKGVFPEDFPEEAPVEEDAHIPDPFEPINRIVYHFNDRLYFWVLKPLALGYGAVAPEPIRIGIRNFFYNLAFPIRFANCMIQSKFQQAGEEVRSFTINTVCGLGGFMDVAGRDQRIEKFEEDLGQTLGYYGFGAGFYILWPILGPSSLRDTLGLIGDKFLYPVSYISDPSMASLAVSSFEHLNRTSLQIGEYEDLKKASFDPYIAIRDAFYQHRRAKIDE